MPETIETERLSLRLSHAEDVEACSAMLADPEVNRFIGGAELSKPETVFRSLGWLIGHWHLRGCGPWVVTERTIADLARSMHQWRPLAPARQVSALDSRFAEIGVERWLGKSAQ